MAVRDYLLSARGLQASQATSPQVQTQGFAPEVMRLANQLSRQRQQAGIGVPKTPDPGVLGRIFDVIQRPLYTSANVARTFTSHADDKPDNPFEAAWRGFSGQDKTTYDKVLEDMGMSGGWQRSLAGLGLDIGLDPTTYLSGGLVKGVTKSAAAKTAAEEAVVAAKAADVGTAAGKKALARDLIEQGTKVTDVETAASKQARLNSIMNYTVSEGESEAGALKRIQAQLPEKQFVVEKPSTRQALQQAKEIHAGQIYEDALKRQDKILAENRGKMIMKFMGKPIPGAESENLYKIGTKLSEVAGKSKYIQGINKAFRPMANHPDGLNSIMRAAEGHSLFQGDRALLELKDLIGENVSKFPDAIDTNVLHQWGGLTKSERMTVMDAMEKGKDLSDPMHKVAGTGRTLEEYKRALEGARDWNFGLEEELGLRNTHDYVENMVPHIYNGGTPEAQAAFKKARLKELKAPRELFAPGRESELAAFNANRNLDKYSLDAAEAAGLKPERDPLQAFGQKIIDSYRNQGKARFYNAAEKEFGVTGLETLKGLGQGKTRELADQMGLAPVKSKFFTKTTGSPEAWFPKPIADSLKTTIKHMDDPAYGSDLLKMFDKVQGVWKLNMTALNPGHHIRNFAGDVFLNFEDGVKNPARYMEAAKVLGRPGSETWRYAPESVKLRIGDATFNAKQIMDAFTESGGKAGFFRVETTQTSKSLSGLHPVERIRQMAEHREDWTRLAHFIDVLKKEGGGVKDVVDLKAVAKKAGEKVRHFNIDYADLTPFERRFMKRVVPFYTWMRKNIPLQLETLALDPGKISTIPKGLRALQGITGAQPSDEQIYGLNVVPKWLREMAGVRIAGEGVGRNQTYWNPSIIPFTDIGQYFSGGVEGTARKLLGSTTPLLRSPIEYATGQKIDTGAPMGDTPTYISQNVLPPSLTPLNAIRQGKVESTDIGKLLGLSLYNVGPQQQLGELRRQQDIVQAILRSKKPEKKRSWEQ